MPLYKGVLPSDQYLKHFKWVQGFQLVVCCLSYMMYCLKSNFSLLCRQSISPVIPWPQTWAELLCDKTSDLYPSCLICMAHLKVLASFCTFQHWWCQMEYSLISYTYIWSVAYNQGVNKLIRDNDVCYGYMTITFSLQSTFYVMLDKKLSIFQQL